MMTRIWPPADGTDGSQKVHENRIGQHRLKREAGRKHIDDGLRPNCGGGGRDGDARENRDRSERDDEVSTPVAVSDWQCKKTPPR